MSEPNITLNLRPPYEALTRIFCLKELYDKIKNIEGDVVECGIAYGGSFLILGALAKQEGRGRRIYGFDSFEGFPEPSIEDKSEYRGIHKGKYSDVSTEQIEKLFKAIDLPKPAIIKGFLENTAGSFKNQVGHIAFLHIDADLYSAYKVTLKELFDNVSQGGIVLFDEYDEPTFPGATKAIDEFFAGTNYQLQKIKWMDKYKFFVIKK